MWSAGIIHYRRQYWKAERRAVSTDRLAAERTGKNPIIKFTLVCCAYEA